MRPAWATRGDPNVLGARQPGAMDAIYAHAKRLGLTVLETVTVNENSVDVVFARCGPEGTPPVVPEPDITQAITGLTDKVTALRVVKTMNREGKLPLIEIKGLGTAIAGIKTEIANVRAVASEINVEAPALRAELSDLRDQIKQHRADLRFEAETLGNGSSDASGTSPPSETESKPQ